MSTHYLKFEAGAVASLVHRLELGCEAGHVTGRTLILPVAERWEVRRMLPSATTSHMPEGDGAGERASRHTNESLALPIRLGGDGGGADGIGGSTCP
jgi:hypothetical protein